MTHQTHIRTHNAGIDDAASLRNHLAALHFQDDIVRPELRNAAILDAQRASRRTRYAAPSHDSLAGRSLS
ncbi:hypothetical protein LG277_06490 [Vreelandella aquamarina]|uniref:hypothetical protein n=1 Tax=Vreelandella aquamarina TaxID=77097 RepID=UPI00384B11BC